MIKHIYEFKTEIPAAALVGQGLDPQNCIFFDIETTGFCAASSHLYLIGAAVLKYPPAEDFSCWEITQWLGELPLQEAELLRAFAVFLEPYQTILHFNGARFDIPYLEEKYEAYQLPSPFSGRRSVDLYQDFRPLKQLLGLTHMNQKSLELFLGLNRDDQYDGGRLIPIYRKYVQTLNPKLLDLLLLHNREDVSGMLSLTSLYSYLAFLHSFITPDPECNNGCPPAAIPIVEAKLITGSSGSLDLLLSFALPGSVPVPFSSLTSYGYLSLQDDTGRLLVPVLQDTLYYFFPNYRDYYYLPEEDQAIHKSVAAYVDKDHRRQATAKTCYIHQAGAFLPQPKDMFTPALHRTFQDHRSWFALSEEWLHDRAQLGAYLRMLLQDLYT